MLVDAFVPPGVEVPFDEIERSGVSFGSARWTAAAMAELMAGLRRGEPALAELPDESLAGAWGDTVEAFRDARSAERGELDGALARLCGLSPEGLSAGLEAVLGGVRQEAARGVLARARKAAADITLAAPVARAGGGAAAGEPVAAGERAASRLASPGPVLVVLASNLPALAVQPLLPALAMRRPVLLKSPSAEPLFAPAFAAALARREPLLAGAVAAATWPGGDWRLEEPVLAGAGPVLAYGEEETLADLRRRAPGRVIGYGPKISLAVIGAEVEPASVAPGLARDVALFDQRGCLSIAAVYTAGDALELARRLAEALSELAARWPPGPPDLPAAAAVQQARLEAEMRGLAVSAPPWPSIGAGTVLVEPDPALRPSPGLRTVRVHPVDRIERLPAVILPWSGKLQGAALAGADAWDLAPRLAALGISRCAHPGELQSPDATWHNGGIDPLQALTG